MYFSSFAVSFQTVNAGSVIFISGNSDVSECVTAAEGLQNDFSFTSQLYGYVFFSQFNFKHLNNANFMHYC